MSRRFWVVCALACATAGPVAAGIVEWHPHWDPEMALNVKVSEFTVSQVDVWTTLAILANECGLVFGYSDISSAGQPAKNLKFNLRDKTVSEIIAQVAARCPDYCFEIHSGVVMVTRLGKDGEMPALFAQSVKSFDAADLSASEVVNKLVSTLRGFPGMARLFATGTPAF